MVWVMRSVSDKINIEPQNCDKILVGKQNSKENFDSETTGRCL